MARRPIFEPLLVGGDGKLDRVQAAIAKAIGELDERLDLVAAPPVRLATGKTVLGNAGASAVVDYRGPDGAQIILPPADISGTGNSRVLYVLNNGSGTLGLRAAGRDTLDVGIRTPGIAFDDVANAMLVALGQAVTLASDGRSRWRLLATSPLPADDHKVIVTSDDAAPGVLYGKITPGTGVTLTVVTGVGGAQTLEIAAPASPGAIFSAYWFSCVQSALKIGATNAATTDTVGPAVRTTKDMVCRGIKFYWKETSPGDSRTMKCTLWQRSGALRLETGHIVVSTTGVYTFTFPAPRTVAAYTTYIGTLWDESSTNKRFTHTTDQEINSGNGGFIAGERSDNAGSLIGPYIMHVSSCFSAGAGDSVPTSTANGRFPIELILDPVPLD